ncbi:hypothetical protein SAMN05216191_12543 [Paenibacillus jilunlii]|uniref:Uncharacterized protein n=1 Tax=Paenibacillus jilunlii TaxID=682956 RepID=A0A1G9Y9Q0_9BACL|nr:hypothetical protein AML91_07325 [Paenibacillus jilunlii]SDN05275.1 hypothetical protein SAMN05216191_12543 [Paenibacillus jilunlii]
MLRVRADLVGRNLLHFVQQIPLIFTLKSHLLHLVQQNFLKRCFVPGILEFNYTKYNRMRFYVGMGAIYCTKCNHFRHPLLFELNCITVPGCNFIGFSRISDGQAADGFNILEESIG